MSRCPSCGGILGRDCFNPIECAQITASMNSQCQSCEQLSNEINYLRSVDMKALEDKIQDACNIISDLIDMLPCDIPSNGLNFAEKFYRDNYIISDEQINNANDDLPF